MGLGTNSVALFQGALNKTGSKSHVSAICFPNSLVLKERTEYLNLGTLSSRSLAVGILGPTRFYYPSMAPLFVSAE